jgi:hypothetical protein
MPCSNRSQLWLYLEGTSPCHQAIVREFGRCDSWANSVIQVFRSLREWVNINLEDLEFLLFHAGQVRSGAQSAGFRGGAQSFRTLTLFSRLMGKARAYLNCSIPFGSRQLRSSSTTRTRGAKPCATVVAFLQEHARTACSFASIHKRALAKSTYEKTAQTSRKQQLSVLVQFGFTLATYLWEVTWTICWVQSRFRITAVDPPLGPNHKGLSIRLLGRMLKSSFATGFTNRSSQWHVWKCSKHLKASQHVSTLLELHVEWLPLPFSKVIRQLCWLTQKISKKQTSTCHIVVLVSAEVKGSSARTIWKFDLAASSS